MFRFRNFIAALLSVAAIIALQGYSFAQTRPDCSKLANVDIREMCKMVTEDKWERASPCFKLPDTDRQRSLCERKQLIEVFEPFCILSLSDNEARKKCVIEAVMAAYETRIQRDRRESECSKTLTNGVNSGEFLADMVLRVRAENSLQYHENCKLLEAVKKAKN